MGFQAGPLRLPLSEMKAEAKAKLAETLKAFGLL